MGILKKYLRIIKEKQDLNQKKKKFKQDLENFKSTIKTERFSLDKKDYFRCMYDTERKTLDGFDIHYVYHTAWAARKLAEINPEKHIDLSSYLYFPLIASAFVPLEFYDYNPDKINLNGFDAKHADITNLSFEDNSVKSLSCMHVVEHIGLGRYDDPLDYDGDIKAIEELIRVTAPEGNLLFVVPIGNVPKIQFNAHRVYVKEQITDYFQNFELIEFKFIKQNGEGGLLDFVDENENYGCGCFWFRKRITNV